MMEKSFRVAKVLTDAILEYAKENPDSITMANAIVALAATTANVLTQCESKDEALRAVESQAKLTCNFIKTMPDANFGPEKNTKNEGE